MNPVRTFQYTYLNLIYMRIKRIIIANDKLSKEL